MYSRQQQATASGCAILVLAVSILAGPVPALAQTEGPDETTGGQSRESMAIDATASQWSYQFAVEGFFDYRDDTLASGVPRPEGNKGFLQFRMVAPLPKSEKMPITLLPRLTLRLVDNKDGKSGFGSSDIFVLGIVQQWSTGRWGIGPQINFPAADGFGNTEWGYGLAGAITERALNDRLFLGLLLQQTWSKDASGLTDETKASPLGINAIVVYQLGGGWYLGNGDFVIRYDWNNGSWFVPLRVRLGKAFIGSERTWNTYLEYGTALDFKDWTGPVPEHTLRINVQLQIPVAFGG